MHLPPNSPVFHINVAPAAELALVTATRAGTDRRTAGWRSCFRESNSVDFGERGPKIVTAVRRTK